MQAAAKHLNDSPVKLVKALPSDAFAISAMARQIWPVSYRGIISEAQIAYMLDWMYTPDRLEEEMLEFGRVFRLIMSDGLRVGFASTGPAAPDGSSPLHKFYLLPGSQLCGLGSKAMGKLCDLEMKGGASTLELRVNRNNLPAISFYRKHQFEVFAENCCEIGGGFVMNDYLMRRILGRTT